MSVSRARGLGISIALALAVGCSDSTDTTAGTGGVGGAAGGGGAAAGTGDSGNARDGRDPMPPAAQGAVSLQVMEFDMSTRRCSPGRHWVNAPSTPGPSVTQRQLTSGTEVGPRAVDGAEGTHVACAVKKNGDKFSFSADITTPRMDLGTALHPTVLHFEASAIAASGPAAEGIVTVMNDLTLANFVGEQCLFSVTPQGSATSLAIDPGRIWASATCDLLADPTSPDDGCLMDVGFLVFENCVQ